MSYWYERISKKHVVILLLLMIPGFINAASQMVGTYSTGCIATASRTLFDWIAVDHDFGYFEVYPYVQMQMEPGCVEWLGFSTCETVQFKEWSEIWALGEQLSIVIWNTTNADKLMSSQTKREDPSFTSLPPIHLERTFTDGGTWSFAGQLSLKMHANVRLSSDIEALIATAAVPNLVYVASTNNNVDMTSNKNIFSYVKVGSLLGHTTQASQGSANNVAYFEIATSTKSDVLTVPAKGTAFRDYSPKPNRKEAVKGLLFFTSIGTDQERCLASKFCGSQCVWSNICEPLQYGHHGLLLPSGSFFLNFRDGLGVAHWPLVPWKYLEYSFPPKYSIILFNPETFVPSEYKNTGDGSLEKYPDVNFWLWKAVKVLGSCDDMLSLGDGKDCDAPPGYVNVDFTKALTGNKFINLLYVSLPRGDDGSASSQAASPEIYSEIISGLRIEFFDSWQINAHIRSLDAGGRWVEKYPLFWISRRPAEKHFDRFSSEFQNYGLTMFTDSMIAWCLYILSFFVMLYMFFYGMTCVDYMTNITKQYAPHEIDYI